MKREDFAGTPSGRLVLTDRSQPAFVPHPLPPGSLDLGAVAEPLAKASQRLGELNGIGRTLTDPFLLIRPLQAREALTSSSMEGTYTTLEEFLLADAGGPESLSSADTREVVNYRRALANAIESLKTLPLSLRTMRDAHRTLLHGVRRHRGSTALPGEFKTHQNFIGARDIEAARFIPPPPHEAIHALNDLEKYIHRDNRGGIPDLVDAALIHYQFETIHPFADGNGRVGRILIPLHLYVRGVLHKPLLYLSPSLERRKDDYIDHMFAVSQRGAWLEWIAFFLDVVTDACTSAIRTADALLTLQQDYRRRATEAGRSSNLLAIVDHLFREQYVTIPAVAALLGVQYRSAQLNIEALMSAGILFEVEGTSNPRYFFAREIRDAINQSLTE